MGRAGTINLISLNAESTPELVGMYGILQKLGYGSLIAFVASGIIVGAIYGYLSARQIALRSEHDVLMATINQLSIKEGLLLTAKQRIAVIDKILAGQKDVTALFTLVDGIASVGQLKFITLDDTNKAVLTIHIGAIEDAVSLVDTLIANAKSNKLSKPELATLNLSKEGGYEMTVSFVPKL